MEEKSQFQVSACDGHDKRISRLKDGNYWSRRKLQPSTTPCPWSSSGYPSAYRSPESPPRDEAAADSTVSSTSKVQVFYARRVLLLLES